MKKIIYMFFIEIIFISYAFAQQTEKLSPDLKPPVKLTAEQDHQRLMKLLGIDSLRPGPSGNTDAPNAAITDESKAIQYKSLPDPLTLNKGDEITTAKMWWNERSLCLRKNAEEYTGGKLGSCKHKERYYRKNTGCYKKTYRSC